MNKKYTATHLIQENIIKLFLFENNSIGKLDTQIMVNQKRELQKDESGNCIEVIDFDSPTSIPPMLMEDFLNLSKDLEPLLKKLGVIPTFEELEQKYQSRIVCLEQELEFEKQIGSIRAERDLYKSMLIEKGIL